jgi:signal transduction histidine kinase
MTAGDGWQRRPWARQRSPGRHGLWAVRALPRRGALGLRGRIIGAVLVTTVATLAVAALALLGPLEQSLRNAEKQTLRHELQRSTIQGFKRLHLTQLPNPSVAQALSQKQQQLSVRVGGIVNVLGYPEPNGRGRLLLPDRLEGTSVSADSFDDVSRAFATKHSIYSFGVMNGDDYARAAIPFADDQVIYVLAVRKPIDEIAGAVAAVRNAFITAALAGLLLTLILGIPLSARLVRRLRRLREAALELSQEGPAVEVPVDTARDEVGDLARTLATMQQRLQRQEEARRSFVATASHELRTPLTSLDGMLELLDDDLRYENPDLEDARALLDRARVQSRRLGRLAADLLDLSRLDAQSALRSEPVELGEISRAVLAEFELGTAERGIATELDERGGSVWALGDPGSIARILRILLDNAVRISPPASTLRIELRAGRQVALSVSDQGPGVPPEDRETIFRRFERGRDTGGQGGFGLGLAIGRELAQRMGGSLALEDTPGGGATFTLCLPAALSPARKLSRTSS